MEMALSMRQLHSRGPDCRGLAVDAQGVVLGADYVLVRRDSNGYRIVDFDATERLLKFAFGEHYDTWHLLMQLKGIAIALGDGSLVKAQILGLQTPLAGISRDELIQLELARTLLKYDPAQPRDEIGRWTTENGGGGANVAQGREAFSPFEPSFPEVPVNTPSLAPAVAPPPLEGAAPEVVALLGRLAAAASGPVLLGGALALIPTNGSNIHEGDIPGRPGFSYRSDEGILTIFRDDGQGDLQRVYQAFPDSAGLYRDGTGRVIGQHVGTGAVFDLDALPLFGGPLETPSVHPDLESQAFRSPTTDSDDPKNCPPLTVEIDNGERSARTIAYQSQITGLLPGFDMQYNGVRFDGCDEITQRMLEAKGLGNGWLLGLYQDSPFRENYYDKIMKQAERQNRASAGRGVDWHFADRGEALFYYLEFKANHFDNIRVYYTESVVKKIEDCVIWAKVALEIAGPYLDIWAGKALSTTRGG